MIGSDEARPVAQDLVGQGIVRAERPACCDRGYRRLPLLSSLHSNMGSRLPGFEQKRCLVRSLGGKIVNFTQQIVVEMNHFQACFNETNDF